MKLSHRIFSEKGILAVTVMILVVAASLAIVGVSMEAHNQLAGLPRVSYGYKTLTSYVMAGVMGDVPSAAGTLQSIGLFVAYVIMPFVVAVMFAIKANLKIEDDTDAVFAA